MSSTPFRFQFDLDDHDDAKIDEFETRSSDAHLARTSSTDEHQSPPNNSNILPFRLILDIDSLLQERCKYELEYEEILLNNNDDDDATISSSVRPPLRRVHSSTIHRLHHMMSSQDNDSSNKQQDDTEHAAGVIPGIYEGGLKVWECSIDLCRYLNHNWRSLLREKTTATTTNILELGCGHGLPTCFLLRECISHDILSSSVHVFFTDYNDYVLRNVTLTNVVLNTIEEEHEDNSQTQAHTISKYISMGAGDWMDMSEKLSSRKDDGELDHTPWPLDARFDLILAAETTYTVESARQTAILMYRHLEPDTGVGLIATKRYYFGVGGGTDAFQTAAGELGEDCDENSNYRLQVEVIETYDTGTSNIRDLLRVRLKSS